MREVTVIIPNYNGIEYIEDCLDSLDKQTMECDIVVVDNASTDGSLAIAQNREGVRVIELSQNFGFCRAVNEGIAACSTKYLILLNNDTKAETTFVEELYNAIDRHDDTFSVAAKMIQMNDPDKIDARPSAGRTGYDFNSVASG